MMQSTERQQSRMNRRRWKKLKDSAGQREAATMDESFERRSRRKKSVELWKLACEIGEDE